ncbi:MAG: helix-turn-helix domain-containing protein [Terriglobia bacterium]
MLLTLTHEEIGQMIGLSRETVTRTMGDFKRRQLVRTKGATLVIQNQGALEQFASL